MSRRLAPLRRSLDAMPSPVHERPGLLLRDPFGYADEVVIVPPPLVPFLRYFDGEHEEGELAAALYEATGDLAANGFARRLVDTLGGSGFLEDEDLARRQAERHRAFAESDLRGPVHAGDAYPEDAGSLGALLDGWLRPARGEEPAPGGTAAIAAPHVSFEGGFRSYASAYRALPSDSAGRTFVVLGTSHYGAPERFGLTRKAYATPFGTAGVDHAVVDALVAAGGDAVVLEDYCHAVEHSIELQVVFLQHLFGPGVRVVPVLVGPFARALGGGRPEDDAGVARFLDALAVLASREGGRLAWVLGVDLAHVGQRYGDTFPARAGQGPLVGVEESDRARLAAIARADALAFWDAVKEGGEDALRWCGSAPFYAFLRAVRPARGTLLRYEQWNIDPASVVSFGAVAFGDREAPAGGKGGA
jgi:hypothetical protein